MLGAGGVEERAIGQPLRKDIRVIQQVEEAALILDPPVFVNMGRSVWARASAKSFWSMMEG